jgi:uncharacterized OsmC-like protein
MRRAAAVRPTGQDWHEVVSATCIADDETGLRKLHIRDWQFIGDSGPAFGGWSLGPSSPEFLCGVVSTCLTHTYLIGAAWLEIPVDRVEVNVSAQNNDSRFLDIATNDPDLPYGITAQVTLHAPDASAGQIAELHRYARERCPITRLIRQANEVTIVTS